MYANGPFSFLLYTMADLGTIGLWPNERVTTKLRLIPVTGTRMAKAYQKINAAAADPSGYPW